MMDNTATVIWLAIIGVATVTQTALLIWVVIGANARVRQIESTLRAMERDHVVPTLTRIEAAMGNVQDFVERARRAEDDVRAVWRRTADGAATVARHAESLWPVWGVVQGVRRAVSVLRQPRPALRSKREAEDAEARFDYEGGAANVGN